jgi:hypothetical protein
MAKEIFVSFGIDVDAVGGWLGSYGGEDSPGDISRGVFAGEIGVPRLNTLLERSGITATWFWPGHSIETFPEQFDLVQAFGRGWTVARPGAMPAMCSTLAQVWSAWGAGRISCRAWMDAARLDGGARRPIPVETPLHPPKVELTSSDLAYAPLVPGQLFPDLVAWLSYAVHTSSPRPAAVPVPPEICPDWPTRRTSSSALVADGATAYRFVTYPHSTALPPANLCSADVAAVD